MQVELMLGEKMNSDERNFPCSVPFPSLARFCEYLTNSQIFNVAIRLHSKGVTARQRSGGSKIHTGLTYPEGIQSMPLPMSPNCHLVGFQAGWGRPAVDPTFTALHERLN